MLKHIREKVVVALVAMVAVLGILSVSTNVAKADERSYGVDWSIYQGAYGVWGYPRDQFSICQVGGYYNGSFIPHWTYNTQVSSTISQGRRAHTYIYAQFTGRWQADQMLNYYLPRVQTPKGSIVALDVESGNPDADSVLYALNRIKDAGYTPVLYGYKNFLINHLGYNNLQNISNQYALWLAEYPDYSVRSEPDYNYFPSFNNVQIFQFTSTYKAGGLDGDIDFTGITKNGYTNGNSQKPVTNTPATNQGKQIHQDTHTYTVRSGDSWWSIANKYHMDMNDLAKLNSATIQTVIHPGQVLRVADSGKSQTVNNKVNKQPAPNSQPAQVKNWDYPFINWNNGLITSNFGMRNLWGQNQFHDGVDIASNSLEGQPVKAIHSGKVVAIGRQGTTQNDMGTYVVVESPDGYSEVYQEFAFSEQEQQRSVAVHVGDEVKTGDTIATMYYGGYPHVNHIHIGVYRGSAYELLTTGERNYENPNSNWVDPMKIIANNGKTPQPAQPAQSTRTYTVQRGDSWWAIANRYGMNMYTLAQMNGKSIYSTIYPGEVLKVNDSASASANANNTQVSTYTVRYGDSWWAIANRYGMNMYTLAQMNGKSIYSTIYPGEVLKINDSANANANNTQVSTYTVRYGDSWWKIANDHGMNMYTLAQLNGKSIYSTIYPGEVLKVTGSQGRTARTYRVNSGDSLSTIAYKLGTTVSHLVSANGISNPNFIYPGQVLNY